MLKEKFIEELLRSSENNGFIPTLDAVFGKNISVRIAFSDKACKTSIDELGFSARANNSLKRSGTFTVGDVIELISNGGMSSIRNLGKKTENEIKTRILAFGYSQLTEREKINFFNKLIELNNRW